MHKAQITLNLIEGKSEGMEEVTIRRSMAVAFTNAVIEVSDRCATHQHDLEDGNLLRNVKTWMGAHGWTPGSSFYKQHIKSEEFIDNETTPRHKAHEYSMDEIARPGLHIKKEVEVEVVLSKIVMVKNGRKMVETAQKDGAELDLEDPNVQAYLKHGSVMVKNGRKKFMAGNRDTKDDEVKAYLESSQYKRDVGREMVETAQKDGADLVVEDPNVEAHLEDGRVMVMNGRTKFMAGNRDTDDGEVEAYLESSQCQMGVG